MKLLNVLTTLLICSSSFAQLTLDKAPSVDQLVRDVFLGEGIKSISNVTYTGYPDKQFARFTGSMYGGFTEGIFMATGIADSLITENVDQNDNSPGSKISFSSFCQPYLSDFDVRNLSGAPQVFDVAVIEFDFIPAGNKIAFEFVFGSEEYPQYVCSDYNDAFGFLISGPGITNTPGLSGKNIALVPGTNDPIAINSVNDGNVGNCGGRCDVSNCISQTNGQYFFSNIFVGPPIAGNPYYTRFNGLTVPIMVEANVSCDSTYHMKLMIGDAGDSGLDSGIFLKANSFSAPSYSITAEGSKDPKTSLEGEAGCFKVIRHTLSGNTSVDLSFSGSANPWEDFVPTYSTSIPFGSEDTLELCLEETMDDVELEGLETVIATISYIDECGEMVSKSDTLYLEDRFDVIIPNIITPNNDGENEIFEIKHLDQYDASLLIKNRWGKTVYESDPYMNDWKGSDLSEGVYFYELNLKDIQEVRTGHVQIIR